MPLEHASGAAPDARAMREAASRLANRLSSNSRYNQSGALPAITIPHHDPPPRVVWKLGRARRESLASVGCGWECPPWVESGRWDVQSRGV